MTSKLFGSLVIYHDIDSRSAALNMAIDEALLETATTPSLRFYRWNHPALSFGYFGKFADIAEDRDGRDIARRWTGGGIVFHGDDLTYALVIPRSDSAFAEPAMSIYEKIHAAICETLAANGQTAELATVAALYERRLEIDSAVTDRRYNKAVCFVNPVRADVLVNGNKVAGAAQRRTRRGLLQQGSIQYVDLAPAFEMHFALALSTNCNDAKLAGRVLERAQEIAEQKYGTEAWLRKR